MKSFFMKIYSFFKGEDPRVMYVSKDEIAKDLKEQLKGNTELLTIFENRLNQTSNNKHGYISLL